MTYIDTGGTNKEVLVLIHGLGGRKEYWNAQLPLARHYRLIILDLRGHGEDIHIDNITLEQSALDAIELVEKKLGIKQAHFLGHSLGGAVVQKIMVLRPDLIKSIILANTTSIFPRFIVEQTVGHLESNLSRVSDFGFVRAVCERGLYNTDLATEAMNGFKMRRDTYMQIVKDTIGQNFLPYIMLFRKPILLISSSHDIVTPSPNALMTFMFNPFARTRYMSNCGHLSNIDKRDEFNRIIVDFIG
jgi:pimeloyl-ACP methyl ester carboxylesterase